MLSTENTPDRLSDMCTAMSGPVDRLTTHLHTGPLAEQRHDKTSPVGTAKSK